jgi:hypothetical protein
VLPTRAMNRLVKECAWEVPLLLERVPNLPPIMVLERAAEAGQGVAVIWYRGRRWVAAPDCYNLPPELLFERDIVREVQRTNEPSMVLGGMVAWPFQEGAWRGVAILVSARIIERMIRLIPAG